MKENKNVNYKARLWIDEKGELHGISFNNERIPSGLLYELNEAMHDVVDDFNGKTLWKENYIKFTSNGKRYEQFDGKYVDGMPCSDCVFRGIRDCQHPHLFDGSKGYCEKPYREVKIEKNEAITPYFEDGVFAGVRVCVGDEDFVIAPKDYNNGEKMTWHYMMYVLEGIETFNHKQACLIAAYYKEIDEILIQNGGDAFEKCTHYWTCEELMHHSGYDYFSPGVVGISVKALNLRVRLIKNLKEE